MPQANKITVQYTSAVKIFTNINTYMPIINIKDLWITCSSSTSITMHSI